MNNLDGLLTTYPRTRIPLPAAWQRVYEETYKESRGGKTLLYKLTQELEGWMHRQVRTSGHTGRLLEIGAGTLNHVRHETDVGRYDVIEPFHELYAGSPYASRIGRFYSDIADIPDTERFDRIVSVAVLEHILDLPYAVARAGLLLEEGGTFAAGIPSEGGFLWGFSWRASVGLAARIKHGLDYGDLMRHEHVSTAPEIIGIVSHFFRSCEIRRFPLPLYHMSLYSCIIASDPIRERCLEFGKQRHHLVPDLHA